MSFLLLKSRSRRSNGPSGPAGTGRNPPISSGTRIASRPSTSAGASMGRNSSKAGIVGAGGGQVQVQMQRPQMSAQPRMTPQAQNQQRIVTPVGVQRSQQKMSDQNQQGLISMEEACFDANRIIANPFSR
eukprot:scaffold7909_cov42-Attheya_sp.AAC.2